MQETVTLKDAPSRAVRGSSLPAELREIQKRIEKLAEDNPFVKDDMEKLLKLFNRALETNRIREDQYRQDDESLRANLNRFFNGKPEKMVRESNDEDMKAIARRKGWRV